MTAAARELRIAGLSVEDRLPADAPAPAPPVVLLHGLTATRRYVVMGSRALERGGHRVVFYDARGHGASDPAPAASAYTYPDLVGDLARVLDELGLERAVLAGASMGAHTAIALALAHPERVAALVLITPSHDHDHDPFADPARLARWDALADGLRTRGIDGFVAAYDLASVPARWRATIETVLRQRLALHAHPGAVADALETVPRSAPFGALEDLRAITAPTVVVASRDEADPGHPYACAAAYAHVIPGARLVVEDEGSSPLAWQGGRLSRVIADLAASAA